MIRGNILSKHATLYRRNVRVIDMVLPKINVLQILSRKKRILIGPMRCHAIRQFYYKTGK
jgi:hypothetical protein